MSEGTEPRTRWWLHGLLFIATCASTFFTFLLQGAGDGELSHRLWGSAAFSGSTMLILTTHEFGHYFLARRHGVKVTLPYFIPLPLGFGTMGAVIRLRGRVPNRNALVDIGAAGPLAGLAVTIPLWCVGVWLSKEVPSPDTTDSFPGQFSLWTLLSTWGAAPEGQVVQVFGDNALGWALQRILRGPPTPGTDLLAHPVLVASWFGFLVTMLNLLPLGQLDGGHLTAAWFEDRAVSIGKGVAGLVLLAAVLFSASWLAWFLVAVFVVKLRHPPVQDPEIPLSRGRKWLCTLCFAATVLIFMPAPLRFVSISPS